MGLGLDPVTLARVQWSAGLHCCWRPGGRGSCTLRLEELETACVVTQSWEGCWKEDGEGSRAQASESHALDSLCAPEHLRPLSGRVCRL